MRQALRTIWLSEPEHRIELLDRANARRKRARREAWKSLPPLERRRREALALGHELCQSMTDEALRAHKRILKTAEQKRRRRRNGVKEKIYVTREHKREKARLRQASHRASVRLGKALDRDVPVP